MKMDLKQLFDLVGEKQEIDCDFDFSNENLYGTAPFTQPLRVTGKIEKTCFCTRNGIGTVQIR